MKAAIIACFVIASSLCSFTQPLTYSKAIYTSTKDSVYICLSSTAHVYHSSPRCRGLNRCTHPLVKVSLKDAIDRYSRRACKICE